ncbi:FG-GAP-like repeat-containing protein [Planctobacterium marinum]|uniref:FG-GAP-like repeat-containing protein n=1 Tax=Planctobacterium marinum TaxID=1631968 RepID=UPI001E4613AD|nr:FG-GAP-like repeat-containing protein [Planctobacterium marinum]MCC2608081.1 FG-GAP-like repeat-containing protein [Planctobacterium marinum]
MRVSAKLLFTLSILLNLFTSLPAYSNTLVMDPFLGNTGETNFGAYLITISEDSGYAIFSSTSRTIPDYEGPEKTYFANLVYIKNLSSEVITPLVTMETGELPDSGDVTVLSEISDNNGLFFTYDGNSPLSGVIYEGDWSDIETNLFRLALDTKTITPISNPGVSYDPMHWLITKNEILYFYNRNTGQIQLSSDLGENWQTIETNCRYRANFNDFTENGSILFSCSDHDGESAQYYDVESQNLIPINRLPANSPSATYNRDGIEMSKDGNAITLVEDNIITKIDKSGNTIFELPLSQFNLVNAEILAMDAEATYALISADYQNSIYFVNETQRFNVSESALFYVALIPSAQPIRINVIQSGDGLTTLSVRLPFIDDSNGSVYLQEFGSQNTSIYRKGASDLAEHSFSKEFTQFALSATNQSEHNNRITVSHDIQDETLIKILRTSEKTGLTDTFWLEGSEYDDQRLGLRTGSNRYIAYPCDYNMLCSEDTTSSYEITTLDFQENHDWTLSLNQDSRTSDRIEASISNIQWTSYDRLKITRLSNGLFQEYTATSDFVFGIYGHIDKIDVAVQPCMGYGTYNSKITCSDNASSKSISLPQKPEVKLLTATDHSYIAVYFEQKENLQYIIEKRISGEEFIEVASDINSGWQDDDIRPGDQYTYRVIACDTALSLCRASNAKSITIDRKSDFTFFIGLNQTVMKLDLRNYNDVDEISILRATGSGNYQELASVSADTGEYIDDSVIPGVEYHYLVQTKIASEVWQEARRSGSTRVASSFSYDFVSELSDIVIDDTYALGHLINWSPTETIDEIRVEVFLEGDIETTTRIDATETSEYFYSFEEHLNSSEPIIYRLTPIVLDCRGGVHDCDELFGPTSTISRGFPDSTLTSKQLYPAAFKLSQESLYEALLNINTSLLVDSYSIQRKKGGEDSWQTVAFYDQQQARDEVLSVRDSSADLISSETYLYRVKTCSSLLNQCVDSPESSIVFNGERYDGVAVTPSIEVLADDFEVNFNFDSEQYIGLAEVLMTWDNGRQKTVNTNNVRQSLRITKENSMGVGDVVTFTTRYCYQRPYHPYNQTDDCTEYSELVEVEVLNVTFEAVPEINRLSASPDFENGLVNLTGQFKGISENGRPENIELFKSIDGGNFQLTDTLEIEDSDDTNFQFGDNSITHGERYQYVARACNQSGCYEKTTSIIEYIESQQVEAPDKPVLLSVSNRTYFDRIDVTFEQQNNTSYYVFYRADDPEGEFERVGSNSSPELRQNNLQSDTSYFYRVDACNDAGCTESDIVEGRTATLNFNEALEISGESLRNTDDDSNLAIRLDGETNAMDGILDAFHGELSINQWLNLRSEWRVSTNARLDANWSYCSELLEFNLQLPYMNNSSRSPNYFNKPVFKLYYTGNGCTESELADLAPFTLYLTSDYLASPVILDNAFRETWHDYTLEFENDGHFAFIISGQEITNSDSAIELSAFELSKLMVSTEGQFSSSTSTYLSSLTLSLNTPSELSKQDELSFYVPTLNRLHTQNLAISSTFEFQGSLQYLQIIDETFGDIQELAVTSNGRYRAYIEALSPNQDYEFLVRHCSEGVCGPFEYEDTSTPEYRELTSQPRIYANLDETTFDIRLHVTESYRDRIDTYTISRQIVNENDSPEILLRYSIKDMMDFWLGSEEEYVFMDSLLPGQTAIYTLEVCNPIGCATQSNTTEITMLVDSDGDGVPDPYDTFPNDPNEAIDTDGDGIGNNADEDDDGDGIPDSIELSSGLDPLNRNDADDDFDGDGFHNIFEYLAGSDMSDDTVTPENLGIFDSFETPKSEYVTIEGDFDRSDYSGDGKQSIHSYFQTQGSKALVFEMEGRLTDGSLFFTYDFYRSRSQILRINGIEVDLSNTTVWLPRVIGNQWSIIAIPLEATNDVVRLELEFHGIEGRYPAEVYIDSLFIPMTDAKIVNRSVADYDGDGKTDVAVRKGSLGMNYVLNSSDAKIQRVEFGSQEEDIQVEGDFDGDGIADIAVRRPSKGIWYVQNSSDSNHASERQDGIQRVVFGKQAEDIPVPADYDGDGITDFAVRRASNSMWYIKNSSGSNYNSANEDGIQRVKFGLQASDIPVPADYDGDGKADVAFRRPSNSTWYILESSTGEIQRITFGLQATDIPVPADYDGDGKADVAFRRPSNKTWYVLRSSDEVIERIQFGLNTADIPVVGDYDGDGKADIAVRRESNSMWYILQSSDGEIGRVNFGKSDGMVPVLTPIWEKLNMLGWQKDFINPTLSGRTDSSSYDDDEAFFLDKTLHYNHVEMRHKERLNQEPVH